MRKFLAACLAAVFIMLLFGCTSQKESGVQKVNDLPSAATFSLPESPIEYTGHYVVDEGGSQLEKTIWRSGKNARIGIGPQGSGRLDFFFVANKAYTCANTGSKELCFDVTETIGNQKASELFPQPDMNAAEDAGEVDIGSTKGRCYFFPHTPFEKRKMCFTDRNVLAFDQYNTASGKVHTEYLTSLTYSVGLENFALPAPPQAAPEAPEN